MDENMIYVPLDLFKELVEANGRMKSFASFVRRSDYSISKKECAAVLGFELEEDNKNA